MSCQPTSPAYQRIVSASNCFDLNMSAASFTQFPELADELRSMIWVHAVDAQIRDMANRAPPPRSGGLLSRERRWQAFVGHANLPDRRVRRYLQVRVRDPYDGRKMRLEKDEFETLVHCLPLSAVCREARAHAAEICQALAPHVHFDYDTSPTLYSLDPPEDGADPVLLRDVHCSPEAESLEHAFSQPTSLAVRWGRSEFKSPEHFVGIISRFFGRRIERVVLQLCIDAQDPRARAYWANHVEEPTDMEIIITEITQQDPSTIHVTRDRKLYVAATTLKNSEWDVMASARHLLRFHEIIRVSSEILPCLKHIDLQLKVQGLDGRDWEHVESNYVDGIFTSTIY